jgi:hypothetical protein
MDRTTTRIVSGKTAVYSERGVVIVKKLLGVRSIWFMAVLSLVLLLAYSVNSPVVATGASQEPPPGESPEPPGTVPNGPPFSTDCEQMSVTEQSRENVLPDVVIIWDSSFHCIEADEQGTYGFTATLSYEGPVDTSILLDEIRLTHTTPRPMGEAPEATANVEGLPLLLTADGTEVTVTGEYELATPGAARLANLHFCAEGQVQESGTPFALGLNAHLRGSKGGPPNVNAAEGPPVLSDIEITTRATSILVTWNTDQPASGRVHVEGGPENASQTVSTGCEITETHEVEVTGLEAGSTYTVEVSSASSDGTVTASAALPVTTQPVDEINVYLPVITQ